MDSSIHHVYDYDRYFRDNNIPVPIHSSLLQNKCFKLLAFGMIVGSFITIVNYHISNKKDKDA
jgi:hypothetical protein